MDNTIIQQGSFTSTGEAKILDLRSDVDWMEVINDSQFATTQTPGRGIKFEWQRGLAAGAAYEYFKTDATDVVNATKILTGGFSLIPKGASPIITGTTITKNITPVCTAANHGFSNGDTVLFTNMTNMVQLPLILFSIGSVTTNTFTLPFFSTNGANFVAETAFKVQAFPDFSFKPSENFVAAITKGTQTIVTLTAQAPHVNFNVGGQLRFNVPEVFGMQEINTQIGTIIAIDEPTNNYIVDIDSTAFSDFAYPSAAAFPYTTATVTDIGTVANNSLDATSNLAFIGMELGAGINGPAGSSADKIFWKAGKSFSVTNE